MRKLVYYLATSLDGFIAAVDGDFSVFANDPTTLSALFSRYPETCPVQARAALGVTGSAQRFDAVILGRRTHQPAVDAGLPNGAYPHLKQYVVSHHDLGHDTSLVSLSGDLSVAVRALKAQPGKDIWLCGGADVAAQLVDEIDEIEIKLNPVLLGRGIPLLPFMGTPRRLQLTSMEELPGGVAVLTYTQP